MPREDTFADLARYYDPIMEHVDYERWRVFSSALGELLPPRLSYLDAGCGTGKLLVQMHREGWRCTGIDLSPGMIRAARKANKSVPLAVADLRALPFERSFHLVTCLFDSLNFLLEEEHFEAAVTSLSRACIAGGILYFDVITERMVTEYFEGPGWTESNSRFTTRWRTSYDKHTKIAETIVQVNKRSPATIRERIYDQDYVEQTVKKAGLTLLDAFDAETWAPPTAATTRIDFVAAKSPSAVIERKYVELRDYLRAMLKR